jgi:D-xylose transport system substrate-binding protein
MHRAGWLATVLSVGAAVVVAGCGSSNKSSSSSSSSGGSKTGKVAVLLPDTQSSKRWETVDRPLLQQAF